MKINAMAFVPLIVAFAFVLALAGEVAAATCIGQTAYGSVTIRNIGAEDDTYFISVSDPDIIQAPESVFIGAGSTEVVEFTVIPQKIGLNPYQLIITSSEKTDVKSGVVEGIECRDVTVIASPSEIGICEGAPAIFDIIVKNDGQVAETFDLSTSMGSLEMSKVELLPGEKETVMLTIDTEGVNASADVFISAASGDVSDTDYMTIFVKNCYSAELRISPEDRSMCLCTSVPYQVYLKNTGELADEYTLTMMQDIMQTVLLEPGESRLFNFSLPLQYGSGSIEVEVTVESAHVSMSDTATLTIKPQIECYSAEIVGETEISMDKCCAETVPIKIKNSGENTQIFRLYVDGPDWVYLSRDDAYVDPGEEKEVYLYVSPEYEAEAGSYFVTLNATSQHSQIAIELTINLLSDEEDDVEEPEPVENVTGGEEPTENITGEEPEPEDNVTGEEGVTLNVTIGEENMTGGFIALGAAPLWKTIVVAFITLIIVVILVVRFAILVKK